MPTIDNTLRVSDELFIRLRAKADAEGKSINDLAEEAVRRLLMRKDLRAFVAGNRQQAEDNGLTQSDIPRLVNEYRHGR